MTVLLSSVQFAVAAIVCLVVNNNVYVSTAAALGNLVSDLAGVG